MPGYSLSLLEQIQISTALEDRKAELQEVIDSLSPEDNKDAEYYGDALKHTRSALDTINKMIR